MALHPIDRELIQQCLAHKPQAWKNFVDRFLGLVVHVIRHSAQARSIKVSAQDQEDLASEVFLAIVADDYALLRRFRGESSLATYLTVVARRVVIHGLVQRKNSPRFVEGENDAAISTREISAEERISNREEVERLLNGLNGAEADVIRMYHLEGKSYQEISTKMGMPENSIGPTLSRAREKLRRTGLDAAAR